MTLPGEGDPGRGITPWRLADALGMPPPTDEQAAVIAAPPGPTLVVAGAGAGKTETMAARVVWMVANGLVAPDAVLGLTFTRKAAQQLTTRIRTRLARLAGSPILREIDPSGSLRRRLAGSEPEISTYHSYAGRLLTEHGLLLPVEPSATLLTETQLWQLAHRVVTTWDGDLDTERAPVSVTEAVLALSGQLAEHLVEPEQLVQAHTELEKLVFTLPKGPRQRGGPSQELQNIVAVQTERVALLPLVRRLAEELRRRGALDFGSQMSLVARLAAEHPEVGAAERDRFHLVLLDEYQDTGHAQRILLAALFGDLKGTGVTGSPKSGDKIADRSELSSQDAPQPGPAARMDAETGPPPERPDGATAPDVEHRTAPKGMEVYAESGLSAPGRSNAAAADDVPTRSAEPGELWRSGGGVSGGAEGDVGALRSGVDAGGASVGADVPERSGVQGGEHRGGPGGITTHAEADAESGRSVPGGGNAAASDDGPTRSGGRGERQRTGRDGQVGVARGAEVGQTAAPGRRAPDSGSGQVTNMPGGDDEWRGASRRLAVTAVGDPMQSIYGWRGASAANLPRFATDFPSAPGVPAPILPLLTSWRNPPEALDLANLVAEPLRHTEGGVSVDALRPRPGAVAGAVALALTETVANERDWVAERIAAEWEAHADAGVPPPTSAVLVRRNADAAPLAEALRERGLPVEIVGLGGLLATPEVADVVATLRLIADPSAGSAAMRILTGARWRIGVADLAALSRRARDLSISRPPEQAAAITDAEGLAQALREVAPEPAERAGIADAIADPGGPEQYSYEGYQRILTLGQELAALRERGGQSLPELVSDVERTIGVGVETQARRAAAGGGAGREHLDAFAEVVAGYASDHRATLTGLLAFLAAAEEVENGLEPGEVEVARDRVQVLTVHAAKGLEWEVVAVPHVVRGVFPSGAAAGTWLGALAELPTSLRGDRQREDARDGVPVLDLSDIYDRADLEHAIKQHKDALNRRRLDEERRLFYVALTRTERALFVSAHHWAETGSTPKGPSDFLLELKHATEAPGSDLATAVRIDRWEQGPPPDAVNPFADNPATADWPRDPLGKRRAAIESGAALVRAALENLREFGAPAGANEIAGGRSHAEPEAASRESAQQSAPGESHAVTAAAEQRSATAESDGLAEQLSLFDADEPGVVGLGTANPNVYDPNTAGPSATGSDVVGVEAANPNMPGSDVADSNATGAEVVGVNTANPSVFDSRVADPNATGSDVVGVDAAGSGVAGRNVLGASASGSAASVTRSNAEGTSAESTDVEGNPVEGADPDDDPEGWAADVDALLAEHFAAGETVREVELPEQLPATALVELRADPAKLAARLRRPLPYPPSPFARRGTAFHAWLQRWFGAEPAFDLELLPGEAAQGEADAELIRLQEAFLSSSWANRNPVEVEVAFETSVAGTLIRGRMDAVFAEPGGGWLVVDWKTGAEPTRAEEKSVAMQLAVYRLAWARLMAARTGDDEARMLERIGAAFHYVRTGRTIAPPELPGPAELAALINETPLAWSPPEHDPPGPPG